MNQDSTKDDKGEEGMKKPPVHCFIDPMARIVGDVVIGEGSALWPGAIIEGDNTEVGEDVVIMPKAHVGDNTSIGDRAFISPSARLEGCLIAPESFIGMGAVIGEGAEVGKGSVISHDSIIPEGMKIPEKSIVSGVPGKVQGKVTDDMSEKISEIRSHLDWRKEEVKIMLKRGELFGVNEVPKRPDEIRAEYKKGSERELIERETKFMKMFGLDE